MQARPVHSSTVVLTLAGLPAYALIAFYLFVAVVRIQFGYWPWYGHPDAGTFDGLTLGADVAVLALLMLGALGVVVWVPVGFASLVFRRFARLRKPVGVFVVAWVGLMLLAWLDPGAFFEWYTD